jgi:hypothetical protein
MIPVKDINLQSQSDQSGDLHVITGTVAWFSLAFMSLMFDGVRATILSIHGTFALLFFKLRAVHLMTTAL